MKIIKSVLNDIIVKIETENENNGSKKRKLSCTEDKNKLITKETSICDGETTETKEKLESENEKDKGNNDGEKSSHDDFSESKIVQENVIEETDVIADTEEEKMEGSDLNKSMEVLSEHEQGGNEATDEINNASSSEEQEMSQKSVKNPSDNFFERMEEYKNEEQVCVYLLAFF